MEDLTTRIKDLIEEMFLAGILPDTKRNRVLMSIIMLCVGVIIDLIDTDD